MDSTEFNKIAGGVLGAFLVFLLLNFFANKVYGLGESHGGEEMLAYAVEIEDAGAEAAADSGPDLMQLAAAADPAAGEKVFSKCKSCHKIEDGANAVGPHLWGVVGRGIASVAGYGYSAALSEKEGDWTLETLSAFLENPKGWAPGTSMGFAGLRKAEDRVNLIAYLNEADGSPIELAAADAGSATDAATEQPAAEPKQEEAAEPKQEEAPAEDAAKADAPAEAPKAEETATEQTTTETAEQVAAADAGDTKEEPAASAEQPAEAPAATAGAALAALAGGDAAAGEKVFRKCRACHKIEEGAHGVGPSLYGVVGKDIASADGYNYSDALSGLEGTWTPEALSAFLEAPRTYAPGTKMAFGGLRKEEDRINLITYLNGLTSGN